MPADNPYIGSNGHVAALGPATGGELWRTRLGGGMFSAAIAGKAVQFVSARSGSGTQTSS